MGIIKRVVNWARIKSPWILHFNTGACNACDIEIIATLTPRYDLERFGVQLRAPRATRTFLSVRGR
jgi:Ni,Fe-hydrogenase III small subunit